MDFCNSKKLEAIFKFSKNIDREFFDHKKFKNLYSSILSQVFDQKIKCFQIFWLPFIKRILEYFVEFRTNLETRKSKQTSCQNLATLTRNLDFKVRLKNQNVEQCGNKLSSLIRKLDRKLSQ